MSKKKSSYTGIVYSTDPAFKTVDHEKEQQNTIEPAHQNLRIRLDTKHRSGKAVTLVEYFTGKEDDLEKLGKQLKTFCGTGGSVKDGQIIIQGDQREKIFQWLIKNGYNKTKK
ncbi:MAG TPA: translation initiation factor [Flavitalea sp.]|nr:translation initiation factor [Flavitalea sp.]